MRSSGLRGGGGVTGPGGAVACFAAGGREPVFDAVEEAVDDVVPGVEEAAPDVAGKPVVGLVPGGVSERGAGAASCANGEVDPFRRVSGRRFALVETNPVVPAPEPGGRVKFRG